MLQRDFRNGGGGLQPQPGACLWRLGLLCGWALPCGLAADVAKSEEREGFAGVSGGAALSPGGSLGRLASPRPSRVPPAKVPSALPPRPSSPQEGTGLQLHRGHQGAILGLYLFGRNEPQRQGPCPASLSGCRNTTRPAPRVWVRAASECQLPGSRAEGLCWAKGKAAPGSATWATTPQSSPVKWAR